jgi:Domain of unknown function (DUF6458)
MGIGFSVFLVAVGAILSFAVKATVAGLDIRVVGWILMAAGALLLILTVVVFAPRRQRTVVEASGVVSGEPALGSATVTPQSVSRREVHDDGV